MRLLSREARRRYGVDEIEEASHSRLRELAHAVNEARRRAGEEDLPVSAGELGGLVLLQDLLAGVLSDALRGANAGALEHALEVLEEALGQDAVDELVAAFIAEFEIAPPNVDRDASAIRLAALEALLVLAQCNRNPALATVREFVDDRRLPPALYAPAIRILEEDLRHSTSKGLSGGGDLIDRLAAPAQVAPLSIADQIEFFLEADRPEPAPRQRLERALDALREERVRPAPGPGPKPIEVPQLAESSPVVYHGPPRPEPTWMRDLVLTCRHTHVWLDQLSRRYRRSISRLDQIPDEELERLAGLGLSGLWLVGVWERSAASQRIKRLAGDLEAEASAYSVHDYRVAPDLGGDEALEALQERGLDRGLRLGVDVVPNHFGLDSRWLREHPERFVAVERCPFPGYSFEGPDLSADPDFGVFLEDHYYDRSDAAVVFRHLDRRTGRERFVYHGNDGTSTPWNDTAQLDYSRAEVRDAMADLIVGLAGRYRILRFDAAMTLTRMHFQRLWFPAPGSGGAVPSRSEHGVSTEDFRRAMPTEFWHDVVRRVDTEAPDTLLIAEAFWLMEPYFVRELGMHRVYNSAFMHLLREGENERLQSLLRDTAGGDPEFLRRSVNFMTTPDEASAAEQFGTADRYFGVCTLLATLPGLPLFGHGQVEGLAERYGMEFRRARWTETSDPDLVERHRREIQPLLARRRRFAAVDEFRLLEFVGESGLVEADVYAFSAGSGSEVSLVAFNNSDRELKGSLRLLRGAGDESPAVDLAQLLAAAEGPDGATTLRDPRVGIEIEVATSGLAGGALQLDLAAWQALVLGL